MKLKVTQENLSKALTMVARVASTKSTLPILSNVLLTIKDNRLSVSATNLDIAIKSYLGAQVQDEGSVTIPARLFQDFVNGLPSGVIEIEQDEYKVKISADNYKSVINGMNAEDFPVMPSVEEGATWTIKGQMLKQGLQQVVFAASNDDSRPVLTGVYFHTVEGKLHVAATDSYRLAERALIETDKDIHVLMPATAVSDVLRIIADYNGDVAVTHDDQQIRFQAGDVELVARLIEGNYPDYRKLLPSNFETSATMSKSELTNIVKLTNLFARESAGSIVLSIDEASESIWVRAVASQLGENNATAKVVAMGNGSITLNSRYILDALNVLEGSEVTIGFNGKLEPVLLSSPEHKNYMHVIMPLKS